MSGYAKPPSYPTPEQRSVRGLGSPLAQIKAIPDGYDGTAAVVAAMQALALASYADERVNRLAREITEALPRRDYMAEAAAVLRYFQTQFRYTRLPWNPQGLQRLQTPSETLFDAPVRSGECASLSTAMAAVLMSLGFEVMFRTAGVDKSNPKFFEHVYCEIAVPDVGWLAADPSYERELGWEHPAGVVQQDWSLT